MHIIAPFLLRRTVRIAVIGCGGTGMRFSPGFLISIMPLLASGHPSGLSVTAIDGIDLAGQLCRQPFSESEIGLFKSVALINRLNLFWGLKWEAVPQHVSKGHGIANDIDLVIGCVDTRGPRDDHQSITTTWCGTMYWLNLGKNADSGEWSRETAQPAESLQGCATRTVSATIWRDHDSALDDNTQPSCSAAEALERQLY